MIRQASDGNAEIGAQIAAAPAPPGVAARDSSQSRLPDSADAVADDRFGRELAERTGLGGRI